MCIFFLFLVSLQTGIKAWFVISVFLGKTMKVNTSRMITLNDVNYAIWKGKEDLLYVKFFYQSIITTIKPDNTTDKDWNLLHKKVCGFIRQWIDDSMLNHISLETVVDTCSDPMIVSWKFVCSKDWKQQMILVKQMLSLKYHVSSPMIDHLNKFQGIMNKLFVMGNRH